MWLLPKTMFVTHEPVAKQLPFVKAAVMPEFGQMPARASSLSRFSFLRGGFLLLLPLLSPLPLPLLPQT